VITQPGLTFRFDPLEDTCLCRDRPRSSSCKRQRFVTANLGRIDMATPYLREALRFRSAATVRFVRSGDGPDLGEPILGGRARASPPRRLAELGSRFLTHSAA